MRVLPPVTPTAEQLPLVTDYKPGTMLITGAAGSGKTSTALMRLQFVLSFWQRRLRDAYVQPPIRAMILTYNRTLRAYIKELAEQQITDHATTELTITTFGKWSYELLERPALISPTRFKKIIAELSAPLPRNQEFLVEEVDYLLGRFPADSLDEYLDSERRGRGIAPRMERPLRERLLREVVDPYHDWKTQKGLMDWNDLATVLAKKRYRDPYHILIIDEAQDFSANQIRALINHTAEAHSTTFVIDGAQRIYPRGFTWNEVGVDIRISRELKTNYRNTRQIAAFAEPLLKGLELHEDSAIPNFQSCSRDGPVPRVIADRYRKQLEYVIHAVCNSPANDSHALLQAKGGGWFSYARQELARAALPYAEITRRSEWPTGDENLVLSTMHSAKGLEFDHVYILGLNSEVTPHGTDPRDTILDNYRRLLCMAIGRARKSVAVGYKPGEASELVSLLDPDSYQLIGPWGADNN